MGVLRYRIVWAKRWIGNRWLDLWGESGLCGLARDRRLSAWRDGRRLAEAFWLAAFVVSNWMRMRRIGGWV